MYTMAFAQKGSMTPRLGRKGDLSSRVLGAAKFGAQVLDSPITQGIVSALAPELGAGLAAAKKFGILEKAKHM